MEKNASKRSTGVPGAKGRLWYKADNIEPDALGRCSPRFEPDTVRGMKIKSRTTQY